MLEEVNAETEDTRIPILLHSNAPWVGTGYGTQSALFGALIARRLNYRLAFSAFYGLKGRRLGWASPVSGDVYTVYPNGRDPYGNDVMGAHYKHWAKGKGGLFFTLTDPWVLAPQICQRLPTLAWIPVDHEPLIPQTDNWIKQSECVPLAMSMWGKHVMEEAGHEDVLYAPHGFAGDIFKPGDRERAREALGIPQDAFVVGMVAANQGIPSRKGFSMAFQAYAEFKRRNPDAELYLHTVLESPNGENLPRLCETLGIRPITTDQYALALGAPEELVAMLFQAFDVTLNPSWGEGFGVPLIESQACGTPCITTDFSAMPEVAPESAGNICVPGQKVWTAFESFQAVPDIEALIEALQTVYDDDEQDRRIRRAQVAKHAAQYEATSVTDEFFAPVLREALHLLTWRDRKMVRHGAG